MAVDRVAVRRKLARELMRWVRDPRFRDGGLVRNDAGTYSVIPVLADDDVEYVGARLAELEAGGPVNVAVRMGEEIELVVLHPTTGAAESADLDCPVAPGSHVGMVVALLRERRGRPVACRVVAPHCQLQLADSGRGVSPGDLEPAQP